MIEELFNRVKVDLRELCKSEENKLTQASIEGQIQQASQLSDEKFLELTALFLSAMCRNGWLLRARISTEMV